MLEKQSKKPKNNRGGRRENSGRPKGSTNKISPATLLNDFRREQGMTFSQFINKKIRDAELDKNDELVSKYILGLTKYIIQDVQQIDHTTNGESLQTVFNFPQKELNDWSPIYSLSDAKKD